MNTSLITTSAPGSLMLLGEHAVLEGSRALVCAINRRITVELRERSDRVVKIVSALGDYVGDLDVLEDHDSFRFVLQAIRQHRNDLSCGFELHICSEFSSTIGFGSSAAVTVATHAALFGGAVDAARLFDAAFETVRLVQGRGSGADVAAAVYGGIVGYKMGEPPVLISQSFPLTAVYCGYKKATTEVIDHVAALRLAHPEKYRALFDEMDLMVAEAMERLNEEDLLGFGAVLNRGQVWMDALGVNTPELQEIAEALQKNGAIFGAKISGSGLGDCVVGVGRVECFELDAPLYPLEITLEGCRYYE